MRNFTSFITAATVIFCTPLVAQEASYEDTLRFLQTKANTQTPLSDGEYIHYSIVEIERCVLSSQYIVVNSSGSLIESGGTTFRLVDVDPSKIVVQRGFGRNNVLVEARENRNSFEYRFHGESGYRSDSMESFAVVDYILGPSSDNAPRVARAMVHLVGLCGGAEELF